MESITSCDHIIGHPERFEPMPELFITIDNGPLGKHVYGIAPYLDHYNKGYYFLTNSIDGTPLGGRVVLRITNEAFNDSTFVSSMLSVILTSSPAGSL